MEWPHENDPSDAMIKTGKSNLTSPCSHNVVLRLVTGADDSSRRTALHQQLETKEIPSNEILARGCD